ncbi:MAG: hypothetical protein ACE1ZZ_04405 [Dehalococcoidia bacterium]
MVTTGQGHSGKVNQAFNGVVEDGFNVFGEAWKQSARVSEALVEASRVEEEEGQGYLDKLTAYGVKRNEVLAASYQKTSSEAYAQPSDTSADQQRWLQDLFEQDREAYQGSATWLIDWGRRQQVLAKSLIETDFTALDSAQQLPQNAFNLGMAYLEWWQETFQQASPRSST